MTSTSNVEVTKMNGKETINTLDTRESLPYRPKVSIVIPVYNSAPYLAECIDSVLSQTLQEIEIILIYDKSTDNSLEILLEYQKKYTKKIHLILPETKAGPGGARNLGIKYSHAEYVGFVDSDDIIDKRMFEKMYQKAVDTDCDMVCIQAAKFINSPTELVRPKPYIKWDSELLQMDNKELTDTDMEILIWKQIGGFWTRLIRRSILLENNLFFPEKIRWEDNCLAPIMTTYFHKITFIQEILYYYRFNPGSITNTVDIKSIEERIESENLMLDEMKMRGILPKYSESVAYIALTRYLLTTSLMILASDADDKRKRIGEIRDRVLEEFPNAKKNKYVAKYCGIKQRVLIWLLLRNVGLTCCMIAAIYLKCKRKYLKQ